MGSLLDDKYLQLLNAETRQWVSAIGLREKYPQIEALDDMHEDAVAVRVGSLWGFIDLGGNWIAEPLYSYVSRFSDGLARVERESVDSKSEPASFLDQFVDEKEFAYIDKTGRVVLDLPDDVEESHDFNEGLSRAYNRRGQWGYIDKTGRWVIESHGDWMGYDFHEGRAEIVSNGKRGFIDRYGRIVVKPAYKEVSKFNNGVARVKVGSAWRYIDPQGNFIKKPKNNN